MYLTSNNIATDKQDDAKADTSPKTLKLGYMLCPLKPEPKTLETNVIYLDVEEEGAKFYLKYKVLTLHHEIIESRIPWRELPCDFPETTNKILEKNGLPAILKLISKEHPTLRPEAQLLQVFEQRMGLAGENRNITATTASFDIDQMNQLFCQFNKKSLIHRNAWFDEKVGLENTSSYRNVVKTIRDYALAQLEQQALKLTFPNPNYEEAIKLLERALGMEIFNTHRNNFRLTRFWKETSTVSHIKVRINDFNELLNSQNYREVNV